MIAIKLETVRAEGMVEDKMDRSADNVEQSFALDRSPFRGGRADQSDVFSIDILASSTSISPLPTTRGSTWSNAGSPPPLPKNCNAPPITKSANSPTTSPPGSDHGTKTPNPFAWHKTV